MCEFNITDFNGFVDDESTSYTLKQFDKKIHDIYSKKNEVITSNSKNFNSLPPELKGLQGYGGKKSKSKKNKGKSRRRRYPL
jgi:hypothetical protein